MSSRLFYAEKAPADEREIVFGFAAYLAEGETIASKDVSVPDAVVHGSGSAIDDTDVLVWVKAGTAGVAYRIVCTITTSASRKETMVCELRVAAP